MKYVIITLMLAFSATEADAVVYCAAGVYHAGCVARPGVAVAPRAAVVAPRRCAIVNGVRVCRWGVVRHVGRADHKQTLSCSPALASCQSCADIGEPAHRRLGPSSGRWRQRYVRVT